MTDEDERTTTASSPQDDTSTSDDQSPPITDDAGSDVYTADLDAEDADELAEDTEATEGEPAPESAAPPTEGDGETSEASGAVPEAAGATPPADPPVPWRANLYGQEAEPIPGALYKPGVGVLVPEAKLGQLTALVARGSKYDEFKRERADVAKQIEAAVQPVQFEAQALAEIVAQVLSPEFYGQFGLTPDLAEPYIKEMQFRLREKALERREKFGSGEARATTAATPQAELDPYDADATIRAEVTELLNHPDYHGLFSAGDVQAIGSRLSALNPFVQDEHGNWYLDKQAVATAMALAAEPRRAALAERTARTAQQQAAQVAKRNRAVTGQTTPASKPAAAKPNAAPAFVGQPWENPALSRDERRALWLKAHGG